MPTGKDLTGMTYKTQNKKVHVRDYLKRMLTIAWFSNM